MVGLRLVRRSARRVVGKANDLGMWLTRGALGGGVATVVGLLLFALAASTAYNAVM